MQSGLQRGKESKWTQSDLDNGMAAFPTTLDVFLLLFLLLLIHVFDYCVGQGGRDL